MGGRHVQVVLLPPCNRQSEAALRGHGETKLLGFHFLVLYSAVVDTGKVLFTPSVWILLAGLSLVQSPSCPLRPPVGPLLLPGPPGLLPPPHQPSRLWPSQFRLQISLHYFVSIQILLPIFIQVLAPAPFSLALCFLLEIWRNSRMGLACLWSWKVYPETHLTVSGTVQSLFPLLSGPLHLCVVSEMQDMDFLNIFVYLQMYCIKCLPWSKEMVTFHYLSTVLYLLQSTKKKKKLFQLLFLKRREKLILYFFTVYAVL